MFKGAALETLLLVLEDDVLLFRLKGFLWLLLTALFSDEVAETLEPALALVLVLEVAWGGGIDDDDPSGKGLEASKEGDLMEEERAERERAGQDSAAPMTGPTSEELLEEGMFQTGGGFLSALS